MTDSSPRLRALLERMEDRLDAAPEAKVSTSWPATKASRVLRALLRIGWAEKRQTGSHHVLERAGWADYVFAFHDGHEIGPMTLTRIAKRTGLKPSDL